MALSERDRRFLIIGGAAAGVLVLAFLLMNLFGGGGEEAAFSPGPIPPGGGGPTVTESPTPTPSSVLSFGGRDPFAIPSIFASASASASPSGSATSSKSPSQSPTAPGGGSSHTTQDGKTVVLIDTFKRDGVEKAQVTVRSNTYTVEEGDTFAGNFEMRSIQGDCATIDYGDESFTLCTNPQK